MEQTITRRRTLADVDEGSMRLIPGLLLLITAAAGAIIVLVFLNWVDFGVTAIRGTEADAATGVSDGWFVAVLAAAIAIATVGVLFRPHIAPFLLPMIGLAGLLILAVAGFDIITNWPAAEVNGQNLRIFERSAGDPTLVPYLIATLAIVIAVAAALVRGIELRQDSRLLAMNERDAAISGRGAPE